MARSDGLIFIYQQCCLLPSFKNKCSIPTAQCSARWSGSHCEYEDNYIIAHFIFKRASTYSRTEVVFVYYTKKLKLNFFLNRFSSLPPNSRSKFCFRGFVSRYLRFFPEINVFLIFTTSAKKQFRKKSVIVFLYFVKFCRH